MARLRISVTVDVDIAISDVQNLSVGRPGASTLAPWELFCLLGDALGDYRSSRKDMRLGVWNQMTESILQSDWSCSWKA